MLLFYLRFVGGFITLCPEYCFVVEDANEIIGFALAALDARKYEEKLEAAWFPEMVTKYPCPSEKQEKGETLDSAEEMIVAMHQDQKGSFRIPDIVYKTHPSLLYLTVSPTLLDASVPKRLLSLVLTALKANGMYFKNKLSLNLKLTHSFYLLFISRPSRFSWCLYSSFNPRKGNNRILSEIRFPRDPTSL